MKALKSTGLVPVEFLRANGPYQAGQIAGLDPAMVKKLKAGKNAVIKEVSPPEDAETIDIDDDTLQAVPESPSLGGYNHTPPLGSNRLPGRDRFVEEAATRYGTPGLEGPTSPKSPETGRGRFPNEQLISGGDDAGAVGSKASTGSASEAESQQPAATTASTSGAAADEPPAAPSTAKPAAAKK